MYTPNIGFQGVVLGCMNLMAMGGVNNYCFKLVTAYSCHVLAINHGGTSMFSSTGSVITVHDTALFSGHPFTIGSCVIVHD